MGTGDAGILVNHAQVMQMSDDLATAVKAIEDRLTRLQHELNPLQHQWGGQAQIAYTQAKNTWDQAIDEMSSILKQASITVAQANNDYTDTDRIAASYFNI